MLGQNLSNRTYANLAELLETYDRLKQLGITPYWRVHHGLTLSVYYHKPVERIGATGTSLRNSCG